MFGLFKKKPTDPGISSIFPRLKNKAFIDAVRSLVPDAPNEERPIVILHVADLIITYGFDLGESFQMVTHGDADRMGLTPEALHQAAVENLRRKVPQVRWDALGPIYQAIVGNDLEASLLLVPGVWSPMVDKFKGDLVVGVPARDFILLTSSEDELGVRVAFETVREFHRRAGNHALTKQLLVRTDGNWGWDILPDDKNPVWRPPSEPPPLPRS